MIQIAGLILIHLLMRKAIRIVRSGGVENDTKYEREWNEHNVTDQIM